MPEVEVGSHPNDVRVAENLTENENAEEGWLSSKGWGSNVMKCQTKTFQLRNRTETDFIMTCLSFLCVFGGVLCSAIALSTKMKDFGSVIKTVEGNEGNKCNYPTRLDTYGCGCQHDCDYCFAKSLLDFRGLWDAKHPSVGDMQEISKQIRKMKREVVRLGGMTDCFQPLEKLHRITYKTISLLNRRKIPYLIVTKSALVGEPEYIKLMDRDLAHIQVTVTTLDDEKCTYEKASKPSTRLKAIKTLQNEGFDVQLRLSPFIPNYVNISDLNGLKIDKILVEFLRANSWIQKWFKTDYSEYTINQSGYKHLPLEKKLKYIKDIDFKEMTVCEDESVAYEYWKKHYNHNPNDCCNLRKG